MVTIQIVRQTPNYLYIKCPWHNDHTPSLTIALRGKFAGIWRCWGCGRFGQATDLGLDLNIKPQPVIQQNWNELQRKYYYDNINIMIKKWALADQWNVDVLWIDLLTGGWDGESHTFPMYNENQQIIGIQKRYPNGRKCCIEGSRLGLFLSRGIFDRIEPSSSIVGQFNPLNERFIRTDTLFITEGVSDLACLLDLGFIGIGRPSAMCGEELIKKWLNKWWYKAYNIIIIADSDAIGIESATKLKKYLKPYSSSVYVPTKKDLRETVKSCGKEAIKRILKGL